MMSRIDRIRRAALVRRARKAEEAERPEESRAAKATANLPVPVGPVVQPRTFREERRRGSAEIAAQILGQEGQRRGLRAGPALLALARAAYSRIEWSGAQDRRAGKGRQARTDV